MSSLVARILQDAFDPPEGSVQSVQKLSMREDRRRYPRKKVTLPARWKIGEGKKVTDYDVLLKDISVGGAYTEYVNGQSLRVLEDLQMSPLAMVVRLPREQQQIILTCQTRHIHITEETVGVGLYFGEIIDSKTLAALKEYLS